MAIVIGGSSTQSRGRRPGRPRRIIRCSGARELCNDGAEILSWPLGQYGLLLGYPAWDNPLTVPVMEAVKSAMDRGVAALGSYAPEMEQTLADRLAKRYAPYMRSKEIGVRFFSNGTDVCQAAVALARYATGRDEIISVGYHGGSSPVFSFKPQNAGVLIDNSLWRVDMDWDVGTDDVDKLKLDRTLACVIAEVPSVENEYDACHQLDSLMVLHRINGAYSILDDIVTGFRYAPAGALEYYSSMNYLPGQGAGRVIEWTQNIQTDFVCLGKALSTYGKVSALLGPLDVMEALKDKVFASFTYNDSPLGFVDALATLDEYEKWRYELYSNDLYDDVGNAIIDNPPTVYQVGSMLKAGLNTLFANRNFPAKCIGHPARSAIVSTADNPLDAKMLDDFLAHMIDDYDILLHKPNFVTLAHSMYDVELTLDCAEKVLKAL